VDEDEVLGIEYTDYLLLSLWLVVDYEISIGIS